MVLDEGNCKQQGEYLKLNLRFLKTLGEPAEAPVPPLQPELLGKLESPARGPVP